MLRPIRYGRFGLAEDPTGQIVTWTIGERTYLADVIGVYRRESPAAFVSSRGVGMWSWLP